MPAAFRCRLGEYAFSTVFEKIGHLIASDAKAGFATHFHKQTDAWQAELLALENMAVALRKPLKQSQDWSLLLEYEIPRREKRPDVIVLADDMIFVIEFKIGQQSYLAADEWQAYSYALDLRDFHAASRDRTIIPVLVATAAHTVPASSPDTAPISPLVFPVQKANAANLAERLMALYASIEHNPVNRIDADGWEHSAYRPTPTIIEAAEQLFAGHGVSDISHAFASNLDATTTAIVEAIQTSQIEKCRTICFVTGTPGAGKTLTGLNAVHSPSVRKEDRPPAMFLSGNGPLVKIVREALIRDKHRNGMQRGDASRVVSTFIANVHRFLKHYGLDETSQPPTEHAIIFDEAQRAWSAEAVHKKHGIDQSEPSLILQIMERAPSWSTVIALVGSGQEIHQGEAGLEEWGRALNSRNTPWRVLVSPELSKDGASVAHRLFDSPPAAHLQIVPVPQLHLAVSVRSPRAKMLSEWVEQLLSQHRAGVMTASAHRDFPVALTRDLHVARSWLRERSDAPQRAGLLASSGALRLRTYGIEVSPGFRQGYSYADWFLSGRDDTRSSMQLEVAATEFECQGLEVDWAGVCWGDDLVIDPLTGAWVHRVFRGTKWQRVCRPAQQQYLLNKYRVLLTRARKGIVVWVPKGDATDPTRDPALLDATANYLCSAGIPIIKE